MTPPTFSLTLFMMLIKLWLSWRLLVYSKILQTRADYMQLAKTLMLNRALKCHYCNIMSFPSSSRITQPTWKLELS